MVEWPFEAVLWVLAIFLTYFLQGEGAKKSVPNTIGMKSVGFNFCFDTKIMESKIPKPIAKLCVAIRYLP